MDLEAYDTRLMEAALTALERAAREDLSALDSAGLFALIVRSAVEATWDDDDDDDDDEDEDEGDDDDGGLAAPLPELEDALSRLLSGAPA